MMNSLSLKGWLEAMVEATCETTSQTMGLETVATSDIKDHTNGLLSDLSGSFLSLISENDAIQICFFSNPKGLDMLVRSMLGMGEEEDLPEADITDAVGEIVNVLAGGVKKRLNQEAHGIKLGLPMFLKGKIIHGDSQEAAVIDVLVGSVPAHLLVFRKRG